MKKFVYLLLILVLPVVLCASSIQGDSNGKKKKKRKKKARMEIREERPFALTLDGGWNTIGANGLMASYYVNPRFGLDAGLGIGIKGPKLGIRGKYMLSTKNFAPFVGLGISGRFWNTEGITSVDDQTGEFITYDINNVLYIQPAIGFEYMTDAGFVIGLATGYTVAANDPITVVESNSNTFETGFNILWGSGLIASLNIGYAF